MNKNNDFKYIKELEKYLEYLREFFELKDVQGQYVYLNSTKIDQEGSDFLNSIGVSSQEFYKKTICYFNEDFKRIYSNIEKEFSNLKIMPVEKPKILFEKNCDLNLELFEIAFIPEVLEKLNKDLFLDKSTKSVKIEIFNHEIELDLNKWRKESFIINDLKEKLDILAREFFNHTIYLKRVSIIIYDLSKSRVGIFENDIIRPITSDDEKLFFTLKGIKNDKNGFKVYIDTNLHYSIIESMLDSMNSKKINIHPFLLKKDVDVILSNINDDFLLEIL